MEKKDKMTWYDVTYKQFKQLEPLLALDNDMDRLTGVAARRSPSIRAS